MELKLNMIFRYGAGAWCRHGLATVVQWGNHLVATDTYWRDPNMHMLSPTELAAAELLGNLDDYRKSSRDECDTYLDEDVIFIPIGGTSEKWFVRASAKPDKARTVQQLDWKIESAESKIRSTQRELKELRQKRDDIVEPLDPPGWEGGFADNH